MKIAKKSIIYQIHLRAFTKEGTIKAAEQYLQDIANIGVNVVYLMPIVEADNSTDAKYWSTRQKISNCNNPKNPYRLKDFYKIDSEYGNDDDLKSFINKAHNLGLKVILDLVYLHAGIGFAENNPKYVKYDENKKLILNEYNFCCINFDLPEVREYLWENMLYFVQKFDVDGYRCDVGYAVPLDFWVEGVRRIKKIKNNFLMINEAEINKRPSDQDEAFDINYSPSWTTGAMIDTIRLFQNASAIKFYWEATNKIAPNATLLRCIENHDTANDHFYKRLEAISSDACEVAIATSFIIDGVPMLYNGCEYKDTNRHSIYSHKGQFIIDRSNSSSERKKLLLNLSKLRNQENALLNGKTIWLNINDDDRAIMFIRDTNEESILFCANFSNQIINVRCQEYKAFENSEVLLSKNAKLENNIFVMQPYGFITIKIKK